MYASAGGTWLGECHPPLHYRERSLGGMKALTAARGDDVMCGFQLVSLDVFCTSEKNGAPENTSGSCTKRNVTPSRPMFRQDASSEMLEESEGGAVMNGQETL